MLFSFGVESVIPRVDMKGEEKLDTDGENNRESHTLPVAVYPLKPASETPRMMQSAADFLLHRIVKTSEAPKARFLSTRFHNTTPHEFDTFFVVVGWVTTSDRALSAQRGGWNGALKGLTLHTIRTSEFVCSSTNDTVPSATCDHSFHKPCTNNVSLVLRHHRQCLRRSVCEDVPPPT